MICPASTGVNGVGEQDDGPATRTYRKAKRATDEERTRSRIVDAAEHLHGTVGPARTTVSAIAARAGAPRARVYRHFARGEAPFLASAGQGPPGRALPRPA